MAERIHALSLQGTRDPLLTEIAEVVQDPEIWLDTPNTRFGGMPPRDLLDTKEGRQLLHSVMQAVKHGMFT